MAAEVKEAVGKVNFRRNNFPESVVKDPECPFPAFFEVDLT